MLFVQTPTFLWNSFLEPVVHKTNTRSTLWTCCTRSGALSALQTWYTEVQCFIYSLNQSHTSPVLYPLSEPVINKSGALSTLWTCCIQVYCSIHSLNLLYTSLVHYPLSEPVIHKSSTLSTLWTCCTQV